MSTERTDGAKRRKTTEKTENRRAIRDEREVVLLALLSHEKNQTFSNILVKRTLDDCARMSVSERAFIKRLLEGVIERRMELDARIEQLTKRSVNRLHPAVRQILRMGIYQICYMDAVPVSAACNESVRLAKKHAPARLSGFVNGVLRNAAREENLKEMDLSQRFSSPEWLVQMWEQELGREETEQLLGALMQIFPVSARIRHMDPGEDPSESRVRLIGQLRDAGAEVEEGRWLQDSIRLRRTSNLQKLPGFSQGLWTVQDESSMVAVKAAGLRGSETVFDVCAAPGGKSFFAADLLGEGCEPSGGIGTVFSFDLSRKKTDKIREGARRLHIENIEVIERDARVFFPEDGEKADVVFCDLPCSGLGVIGKKRDIKYRASLEGIASLQALQREILANSVRYLKSGGVLIYSTCTISRLENDDNADWIESELGLIPDDLHAFLPESMPGIRGNRLQLLPHVHGTDGFFVARFRKK